MSLNPIKMSMLIIGATAFSVMPANSYSKSSFSTNYNSEMRSVSYNSPNVGLNQPDSTYQLLPEYLTNSIYVGNCWNYKFNPEIEDYTNLYSLASAQLYEQDTSYDEQGFIKKCDSSITPKGITDSLALKSAPYQQIIVKGDTINAKIVVDIS